MLLKKFSNILKLAAIAALVAYPASGSAQQESQPSAGDSRIRTFVYEPNQVYVYTGYFKYSSIIQFENNETIDSINMGDPTGWQIVTSGSRMFIKPVGQDPTTNMTVFTDKRIYFFELYATQAEEIRDEEMAFLTKFVYPDGTGADAAFREFQVDTSLLPPTPQDKAMKDGLLTPPEEDSRMTIIPNTFEHPEKYNFDYTLTGSRLIAPIKVFDDGEFTYLEFRRKNANIPAIFSVTSTGDEALVNFRISGDYVIVEEVGKQFTLRHGADVACLFNESDPLKRADVEQEKEEKFLGIF